MISFNPSYNAEFGCNVEEEGTGKSRKNEGFILLCLHTYIIGHYNPSVRIIDVVSHTTYVVCVNFYT